MEKLNDKWFRIIGIPTVAIVGQMLFFPDMVFSGRYPLSKVFGMSLLVSVLTWETNRLVLIAVRKRLPGLNNTVKRLVSVFFLMFLWTAILSSTIVYINSVLNIWGFKATWRVYLSAFIVRFSIVILLGAIYEGIYFFRQWKQIYRDTLVLKRYNLQSEIDLLIAQVNPHFLFHSLDTLSAIMTDNKKMAVLFVDELSRVYRYLLQNTERNWVTLDTESRFMEAYIFILKMRFGEGLIYKENIADDSRDLQLPPLTLKVLIEDAIAHNVVTGTSPLSILVYTDSIKQLIVTHNVQHKTLLIKRRRHGLTNLNKKFQLLTEKQILIEENENEFKVTLPLIQTEQYSALTIDNQPIT
jgi:sensor histidine kinase YesM